MHILLKGSMNVLLFYLYNRNNIYHTMYFCAFSTHWVVLIWIRPAINWNTFLQVFFQALYLQQKRTGGKVDIDHSIEGVIERGIKSKTSAQLCTVHSVGLIVSWFGYTLIAAVDIRTTWVMTVGIRCHSGFAMTLFRITMQTLQKMYDAWWQQSLTLIKAHWCDMIGSCHSYLLGSVK